MVLTNIFDEYTVEVENTNIYKQNTENLRNKLIIGFLKLHYLLITLMASFEY